MNSNSRFYEDGFQTSTIERLGERWMHEIGDEVLLCIRDGSVALCRVTERSISEDYLPDTLDGVMYKIEPVDATPENESRWCFEHEVVVPLSVRRLIGL